ncbi:hypothetical protein CLPUN_29010 [Clostridium puniceum]|uniref:Uncharacterized protein n=1 Tax=Clostridium puniceum TaxID=29367 RepID=A0A1S8TE39_9CLOT|nr:hypothetical protein [Clostridium puniceum]OOM76053.1 hypothetical protein CLPUN_29010 [Clostridium puniceum]
MEVILRIQLQFILILKDIDVDYNLGSICVSTTTGSSITVKNTNSSYKVKENDKHYEIKAQIENDRTWDEGPEYIVRTAKLTI